MFFVGRATLKVAIVPRCILYPIPSFNLQQVKDSGETPRCVRAGIVLAVLVLGQN